MGHVCTSSAAASVVAAFGADAVAMVGTCHDFTGHAIAGQFAHSHPTAGSVRPRQTHQQAGSREPNPSWIPAGNDATRRIARRIGGFPGGTLTEVFDIPLTAHILGGAPIGDSPASGVIDPYQRIFGYDGLHVVDGAAVAANLGVNPSLTIVAQAERAISLWPNKGEPDRRPAIGAPYERVRPVRPVRPAVPEHAPAAYTVGLPERGCPEHDLPEHAVTNRHLPGG